MAVLAAGQWTDRPTDTGNAVREILFGLCQQYPSHNFLFISKKSFNPAGLPVNAQPLVISPVLNHYYWEEWQLPRALKKEKVEQLLVVNELPPAKLKVPVTLLVTHARWLLDADAAKAAELLPRVRHILVLSETLRNALLALAPAAAAQVRLVRPGQNALYRPLEWDDRQAVKQEHAGGTEYFLATGTIDPRNNSLPLLKAYSILKKRLRSNVKLILAGEVSAAGQEIIDSLTSFRFRQDVIWLPQPDAATLATLTAGAYGLLFTNRFDGLALPVYNALHCNVPVIAYESPAAREAGGPAVIYADPAQSDDLAEKLILLYKDENLRARHLAVVPDTVHLPPWDSTVLEVGAMLGL
ncbi:glycosyltransferase [Chitinophaga costaii]|nr:glycosyltransferase [Chitinophaga costaii]